MQQLSNTAKEPRKGTPPSSTQEMSARERRENPTSACASLGSLGRSVSVPIVASRSARRSRYDWTVRPTIRNRPIAWVEITVRCRVRKSSRKGLAKVKLWRSGNYSFDCQEDGNDEMAVKECRNTRILQQLEVRRATTWKVIAVRCRNILWMSKEKVYTSVNSAGVRQTRANGKRCS